VSNVVAGMAAWLGFNVCFAGIIIWAGRSKVSNRAERAHQPKV